MKPKNFPARKNQRRIEAVERFNKFNRYPRSKESFDAQTNTENKIVPAEQALNIRTKKNRG